MAKYRDKPKTAIKDEACDVDREEVGNGVPVVETQKST